jgi:hypothetical protein
LQGENTYLHIGRKLEIPRFDGHQLVEEEDLRKPRAKRDNVKRYNEHAEEEN